MNTTTNNQNETQLSTNLLRALALKQYNGEDFFILDGKAYEGDKEDELKNYVSFCESATEEEAETEEFSLFSKWCESNLTEVEELDPDDYNNDYLVLTDEEADEKWEESLDSYIEECIQPEIDKIIDGSNLQYYITFDEDKWKQDARMDGRGHSLASYDGCENEETVNGETFYIYRMN